MTITESDARLAGAQRSIALITAFCAATEGDEDDPIEEETGETFFELIGEMMLRVRLGDEDEVAFTIIGLVTMAKGLLGAYAEQIDQDEYEVLSGLAQQLVGGISSDPVR